MDQFSLSDGRVIRVTDRLRNKSYRLYLKGRRTTGAPMRYGTFKQLEMEHAEKCRKGKDEKKFGDVLAEEAGLI